MTKIAKEFKWEMSHRLPFHNGPCKNIHGHTYKVIIEIEGDIDVNLMVLDYYDVYKIMNPLIKMLDHSFMCDSEDDLMINFLKENNFKIVIIEGFSTAENIVEFFFSKIKDKFSEYNNIKKLKIRVYETEDVYAEREYEL